MSQSQTQHSKFLASLLTSSKRGANPRSGTLSPLHLPRKNQNLRRRAARVRLAIQSLPQLHF